MVMESPRLVGPIQRLVMNSLQARKACIDNAKLIDAADGLTGEWALGEVDEGLEVLDAGLSALEHPIAQHMRKSTIQPGFCSGVILILVCA